MLGKGYQVRTTDGVIGSSGQPVVLYGFCILSDGTAGNVNIYDGASTGGTLVFKGKGLANEGVITSFGEVGVTLGSGCYVDIDTHVTSFTAIFERVL